MKTLYLAVFIFFTGAVHGQSPDAAIRKLTAKQIKTMIDESKGPTIINFWASWCGPCVREIPYFESKIAESATPVKLVLVSLDFPASYPKKLTDFVQKKGYKSEVVYLIETNPEEFIPVIEKKWTGAIPASIFIDNSKNYYQFFNSQLTEARLEIELNNLVK